MHAHPLVVAWFDPRSWGFGSEPAHEYVVRIQASRLRIISSMRPEQSMATGTHLILADFICPSILSYSRFFGYTIIPGRFLAVRL